MIGFLTDPFAFEFFRRALLGATMVGALTGLVGVFVVLRGMSYIGHGLSHAVFGGAVVGYVAGVNFYVAAGLWGFASAVLINQTTRRKQIRADAAIGIITTASFALGVAIISRASRITTNFEAALFGNLLGVQSNDLWVIATVLIVAGVVVFLLYKQMLFMTFDPEVAQVYGVRTGWLDTLFAVLLAATIITSIRIMGVTLIAASLVIPPIIARLLTDRFAAMILLSTSLGAVLAFVGMFVSFEWNIASGASIVLVSTLAFGISIALVSFQEWRRSRRFSLHLGRIPPPGPEPIID